jgi:hypothetical protein
MVVAGEDEAYVGRLNDSTESLRMSKRHTGHRTDRRGDRRVVEGEQCAIGCRRSELVL